MFAAGGSQRNGRPPLPLPSPPGELLLLSGFSAGGLGDEEAGGEEEEEDDDAAFQTDRSGEDFKGTAILLTGLNTGGPDEDGGIEILSGPRAGAREAGGGGGGGGGVLLFAGAAAVRRFAAAAAPGIPLCGGGSTWKIGMKDPNGWVVYMRCFWSM